VRSHAVREIDCLENRDNFIAVLQQIARTDPEKFPGRADDGGEKDGFYPVRADARRVLRHVQNNEKCGP
jgi:hypothetical protein